ncbi:HDOD domain-containing protein [Rhodocaloribacter sp.]
MDVIRKENKAAALGALELQCPPMPQTLLEAMEMMHQPEGPQMKQVIQMVQNDPGVVARLLRVVNSAYYGQRGDIRSVRRAVVILGTVSVTGIVMSMGLHEVRDSLDANTALPFLNLVRHSVATAFLARHLIAHEGEGEGARADAALQDRLGDAYTAALLHDFGKLILLYNHPDVAVNLYGSDRRGDGSDEEFLELERTWFGYDHVETGVYLTRRLRFPEALTTVIALHHQDLHLGDVDATTKQLIYVVKAANKAASGLGFASSRPISWKTCTQDPIWPQLIEERVIGYSDPDTLLQDLLELNPVLRDYVDLVV